MVQQNETLKLFISYSRRDSSAADSLAAAFVTRGFDVRIDRRDLPFGEKWQAELADLIRASDTIVWLISERSVASEWCKWELKQALQLNKRIIPVATQQVDANALPEGIASIQILPRDEVFDPTIHLEQLVTTLQTDSFWIKEHTRLGDRAWVWLIKDRSLGYLLRGSELQDAQQWLIGQPPKGPYPTTSQLAYIDASRKAEQVAKEEEIRLQSDQSAVANLNTNTHRIIAFSAVILPILFTALMFRDMTSTEVVAFLTNPSASAILWKLSSTAFFSSYLWGGHVEASQQAPVYKYAPDRGKLPIGAYAIVLWLLILASILFWVQNFKIFSFVLFGFYCVDMLVGGTFRRRHLSPVFERSRSLYIRAEDYISLEQLHAIESYIYGNWAHYRFCIGAGLILVAIFGEYASELHIAGFNLLNGIPEEMKRATLMSLFVLVIDGWVWYRRIQLKARIDALEDVKRIYRLQRLA